MEIIRELVQSIAVIVILAVFLEMLLPASDMRRYLRLVFGILVMISVLQAAFSLLDKESLTFDVPAVLVSQEDIAGLSVQLEDIMDEGNKIYDHEQDRAIEEYRLGLAKQISSLASLNGSVNVAEVEVVVEEDRQNPNYGRLKEVYLELYSGGITNSDEEKQGIEPVRIQVGDSVGNSEISAGPDETADPKIIEKIKTGVADFYNIPADKVQITYR